MDDYLIEKHSDDKKQQFDKESDSSLRKVKSSSVDFAAGKPYQGILKKENNHNLNREYERTKVDSIGEDGTKTIEPPSDKTNETIDINEVRKNFINISKEILKVYEDFNCILRGNNVDNRNISYLKEEYTLLKREYEYTFNAKAAYYVTEKMRILLNDLKVIKDVNQLNALFAYKNLETTYSKTEQLFKDKNVMEIYNQPDFLQQEYKSLTEKFKKSTEIENIKSITNKMIFFIYKLKSAYEVNEALKNLSAYIKTKYAYDAISESLEEIDIFKQSGILPATCQSLEASHYSVIGELQMAAKEFFKDINEKQDHSINLVTSEIEEQGQIMLNKLKSELGYIVQSMADKTKQGQIMLNKLDKLQKKVNQSRHQNRRQEKRTSHFSPDYRGNQIES